MAVSSRSARSITPIVAIAALITNGLGCASVTSKWKRIESFDTSTLLESSDAQPAIVSGSETQLRPALKEHGKEGMALAIALETARLAEERGMDQDAMAAYLEARRLNGEQRGIAHALAVLYDRAAMTDAAAREYESALAESPGDPDVLCDYGYFLYSMGQLDRAELRLREGLKIAPEHQQCTVNLAVVLGEQKKYDEAHSLFEHAIGPAAAKHNLGMMKLRHGDTSEGTQLIAEASRKDPSIRQSRPILDQIASRAERSSEQIGSGSVTHVQYQTQAREP
ncbi:MAG: tetratricopeptide repeat protein [Planctomycetota bacterium]